MNMQNAGVVAQQMVDRWSWWRLALSDPSIIGDSLPMHSEPELGYYRCRGRDKQWEPVGIWLEEDGTMVAFRANRPVEAGSVWTFCCRQPISYEAYLKATEGGGFDDEPPAPVGHNMAPTDDPLDAIKAELCGEAEQLDEFMKKPVETQAQADKIGIWSKRLADIGKRADQQRVTEKEPHLAASRAVDDRWRDVIGEAKDWVAKAKKALEPFLIAQKRAEEARARAAAEEAARLRREAAEAARQAQESDQKASDERDELLRRAQDAERQAEAKNASAGRTGARVSVRVEKVGVVTDYAQAAGALVAMNHKDMIAVIDQLAQRAAKAGVPFAGMEIKEQEIVR